MQEPHRAELAR